MGAHSTACGSMPGRCAARLPPWHALYSHLRCHRRLLAALLPSCAHSAGASMLVPLCSGAEEEEEERPYQPLKAHAT